LRHARFANFDNAVRARYFVPLVEVPAGALVPLVLVPVAASFFLSQPMLHRPMLQMTSNAKIFFITTPFLNVVGETHFAGPSCTFPTLKMPADGNLFPTVAKYL
jgi:hypothetical protein